MAVTFKNNRGFHDWLIQRVSAVIIGVYFIFIMAYLIYFQPLYYASWSDLFHNTVMKIATFVTLIAVLLHAWIGIWTVFTDYIKKPWLRLLLEVIVIVLLLGYLGWLLSILF